MNGSTHEFERTVLGLRVTFLRVLASVKSMTGSHRLYRVCNKLILTSPDRGGFTLRLCCPIPIPMLLSWLCTCSLAYVVHWYVHHNVAAFVQTYIRQGNCGRHLDLQSDRKHKHDNKETWFIIRSYWVGDGLQKNGDSLLRQFLDRKYTTTVLT